MRTVDLSTIIDPKYSTRVCSVFRKYQRDTKDYHSVLTCESHLGTHIESPHHYKTDWPDFTRFPPSFFCGRAVLLRLPTPPKHFIIRNDLEQAAAGLVKPGDIILLDSNHHAEPFLQDPADPRPQLGAVAANWLVTRQAKAVGFGDGIAIENDVAASCAFHEITLGHNIFIIEVLRGLHDLQSEVCFFSAQPMPIHGLDSCCVRAVAIEGIPGFTPEDTPTAGT